MLFLIKYATQCCGFTIPKSYLVCFYKQKETIIWLIDPDYVIMKMVQEYKETILNKYYLIMYSNINFRVCVVKEANGCSVSFIS